MEFEWEKKVKLGELLYIECLDHTLGIQTDIENPGDCNLYLSGMPTKLDENYLTLNLVRYCDGEGYQIRADTFKVIKAAITRIYQLPKLKENCIFRIEEE